MTPRRRLPRAGLCRASFPNKFVENPRINIALTGAIRLAKKGVAVAVALAKPQVRVDNENR